MSVLLFLYSLLHLFFDFFFSILSSLKQILGVLLSSLLGYNSYYFLKMIQSVSQVNGEQRFGACQCLLAGWVEGSTKEQWHLSPLPSTERAALTPAPLSLTQNLVASVHPHLFLVLFKLLLQSWSQKQVSLWVSESMYGSLKRKFWDSSSPLSHLNVISIVFHRQML